MELIARAMELDTCAMESGARPMGLSDRVMELGICVMDFVTMAGNFSRTIAADPKLFEVAQEESDALSTAVTIYEAAFQKARYGGERSSAARHCGARAATGRRRRRLRRGLRRATRSRRFSPARRSRLGCASCGRCTRGTA